MVCLSVLLLLCPSDHQPGSFLGIGSLVFSGVQHGVSGPGVVVDGRARLFENNIFFTNIQNNGKK